ncbi:MAG: hypothetical protein ACD_20C00328G0004 [uncultured bacterium]|nr:MAG: hypothetical protein ACD_20C00328G0004 [uncultured bacterium]HBH18852.1 hypothetical protein [Cyanobacteria bacterium UBA9579]
MTRKGFTLAEVLVTLAIIGVVAALTIPALIQSTSQTELKTALKKSLATLNQAIVMSIAQDSVDASTCTGCDDKTGLATFFSGKLNILSSNLTIANPYFYTTDGMKYTFDAFDTACSSTEADPSTANCQVLVDVNGDKNPNTVSSGNSTNWSFKDQYRLIIRQNSVIPASNATDTVAEQALKS